jgi:hypothetical protein
MKKPKAKSKTAAAKGAKKSSRKDKNAVDLVEVRKDITNIVGAGASEMTKAMVDEALKGELAPVRYLFEVAGLYPAAGDAAVKPEEDSLARTLLRRLGLPEDPVIVPEDERVRVNIPPLKSADENSGDEETAGEAKSRTASDDEAESGAGDGAA